MQLQYWSNHKAERKFQICKFDTTFWILSWCGYFGAWKGFGGVDISILMNLKTFWNMWHCCILSKNAARLISCTIQFYLFGKQKAILPTSFAPTIAAHFNYLQKYHLCNCSFNYQIRPKKCFIPFKWQSVGLAKKSLIQIRFQ